MDLAISVVQTWWSVIGWSLETRAENRYLISRQGNQDSWAKLNYQESGDLMVA